MPGLLEALRLTTAVSAALAVVFSAARANAAPSDVSSPPEAGARAPASTTTPAASPSPASSALPARAEGAPPYAPPAREAAVPPPIAVGEATPIAPPTRYAYVQYGVAFTVEGVASAGPVCASGPCILGSGGGIAARVGWRPTETFYVGGAGELSKQDPNKLYRLGILKQARAEARYYSPTGRRTMPFVLFGLGLAGYGNEAAADTWGFSATLGAGIEIEMTHDVVFVASLAYRPIYLQSFTDSSTLEHPGGVAHFVGLDLALELQESLWHRAAQ